MIKTEENIKIISFDEFFHKQYIPLLKKVEDLELNFKKEQEGNQS